VLTVIDGPSCEARWRDMLVSGADHGGEGESVEKKAGELRRPEYYAVNGSTK